MNTLHINSETQRFRNKLNDKASSRRNIFELNQEERIFNQSEDRTVSKSQNPNIKKRRLKSSGATRGTKRDDDSFNRQYNKFN